MRKTLSATGGLVLGFALVLSALPAFATTPQFIGRPSIDGELTIPPPNPNDKTIVSKTFSQRTAIVDEVNVKNNTITVHYLYACPAIAREDGTPVCTTVVQSEVISPDTTMFLTTYNVVLASVKGVKQGSQITVYVKAGNPAKAYLVRISPCVREMEVYMMNESKPSTSGVTSVMPVRCDTTTYPPTPIDGTKPPVSGGGSDGNVGSGVTTEPGTSVMGMSVFVKDLEVGTKDETVRILQDKLRQLGVFPSGIQSTGYFGPATKSAVQEYQRQRGIPSTGFFGPKTRSAIEQDQ